MDDIDSLLEKLGGHLCNLDDANSTYSSWIGEVMELSNCEDRSDLSAEKFKKLTKNVLAETLYNTYKMMDEYYLNCYSSLKYDVQELKSHLISSQAKVVKLQGELLDTKSKELQSVETAVKAAVQDTVQAEMMSYSKALSGSTSCTAPKFTEQSLKKVVQKVVREEDRSRNVMIFGLKEEAGEDLSNKVNVMFEQIEEKPRCEAIRVGRYATESDKTRPIKVVFNESVIVHQILVKAKELRLSEDYKSVFISPDRSPEERVTHQKLVLDLKQFKAKDDPDKRYFIRSGRICSEGKT